MGDILDYCQGLVDDDNFEGVFISPNEKKNIPIKRRKSDIKIKDVLIPINSIDDNNNSQYIINSNKLKNVNNNINSDEKSKFNTKNENLSGIENELIYSISKLTQIIETLENKNKTIENEKNELKKENLQLLKEIEKYKEELSKIKNQSKNISESADININNNIFNENKNEKIKILFLFKNNQKGDNEKEEMLAYRYEMFIEVKLRLIKCRNLRPGELKYCYFNSKVINDWLTLEELNIGDNANIVCEYA